MVRKILFIILGCMSTIALTFAKEFDKDGLRYSLKRGEVSCSVTGIYSMYFAQRNMKKLVIPESIEVDSVSYKVTYCHWSGDYCFDTISLSKYVNRMEISNSSVKVLDLSQCDVKHIGGNIRNCHALESVKLPNKYKTLSRADFVGCENLRNIELPDALEEIDLYLFAGRKGFSDLYIPKNVKKITPFDFYYEGCICSPAELGKKMALLNAPCFKAVKVDGKNQSYCSIEGVLYNKEKTELIYYPPFKADSVFFVPNSVKKIRPMAFFQAKNLKEVYLPDSLHHIGNWAFAMCTSLDSIRFPKGFVVVDSHSMPESLKHIYLNGDVCFDRDNPPSSLHYPDGTVVLSEESFCGKPSDVEYNEHLSCDSIKYLVRRVKALNRDAKTGKKCNFLRGDSLFWRVVKCGKEAIPCLLTMIGDTTTMYVTELTPFKGYIEIREDVSKVCIGILSSMVSDIADTLNSEEVHKTISEARTNELGNIYTKYRTYLSEWYEKNKDNLTWIPDLEEHRLDRDDGIGHEYCTNPVGGYYELYKK